MPARRPRATADDDMGNKHRIAHRSQKTIATRLPSRQLGATMICKFNAGELAQGRCAGSMLRYRGGLRYRDLLADGPAFIQVACQAILGWDSDQDGFQCDNRMLRNGASKPRTLVESEQSGS